MLTPAGDICLIDFNISGVKTEEGIAAIGYSDGYAPVEQFAMVARRAEQVMAASLQGQSRTGMAGGSAGNGMQGAVPSAGNSAYRTEVISGSGADETEVLSKEGSGRTEVLSKEGSERTEVLPREGSNRTEVLSKEGSGRTEVQHSPLRSMSDGEWAAARKAVDAVGKNLMIDERTDIYSVGATLYHILTGQKPRPFYQEQIPLEEANENVSEGLACVIEKAMAVDPAGRFKNSSRMLKAVRNLGAFDRRYHSLSRRQLASAVLTGLLTVASALSISQGRSVMAQEKEGQYRAYIEEMQRAREDKDYDRVAASYGLALGLSEEGQDAYYEMALAYYQQKQYDQCIDYLSRNVYTNSAVLQDEGYGRFYYITASCHFELEDYNMAVSYYRRAVDLQPEEMAYYRDYVVALARNGQLEEAEQVLNCAVEKGISADVISLLQGEIALLRGNYQACEQYLLDCIADTEDDYIRLRAYTKLDDAGKMAEGDAAQYEIRIGRLKEALEILPDEYQVTLMERLAQVYIDYSDIGDRDACCGSAIALFEQMEERGYATFTSRCNIAVLYEKMGRYGEAEGQLEAMLELYPDNYVIYKRLAFLEVEIQAEKANADRDYHVFQENYNRAQELYRQNASAEDMEMLSLQQLYQDVKANGWL